MKKSFLGLIALCSVTGAAYAQTNVSIYGVVDAGIAWEKDFSAAEDTWRLQSGQQSGSRIGFKGTEDLGSGLSAIFTLENGFNADDGTLGQGSRLFGRQAWVGLTGGFGSVRMGRQQTPLYYALDAVDPFGINLAGNAQRVFGYGLYAADPLSRTDNSITYTTPNFSGFTATVLYGFGEQPDDTSLRQQASLGVAYVNGPINVQFVYHDANTLTLPTTATAFGTGTPDVKNIFLGGTFDFGVAKLHAAVADGEGESPGITRDFRNYLVGASAPVGAGTVMASWVRNDLRDLPEGVSDQFAIGYSHPLSKRTNFYTSYGQTKNDDQVRLNAFANGATGKVFNVGVRHRF